jgi:hypothetical protein
LQKLLFINANKKNEAVIYGPHILFQVFLYINYHTGNRLVGMYFLPICLLVLWCKLSFL